MQYTIEIRNSRCYITPKPHYQLNQYLNAKLSYELKGSYFIKQHSNFDGVIRLYNKESASFPIGFLERVLGIFKFFNIGDVELSDFRTTFEPKTDMFLPFLNTTLRDYQIEAADVIDKKKLGIFHIATGGGKTILAAEIIRRLKLKTLFLVHTQELLKQTKTVFETELKIPIGIVQRQKAEFDKQVVVAMVQTLHKNIKKYNKELASFNMLMIDEAHHASADMIYKISMSCPNTTYKYGFSGSPHRDDGHDLKIEAAIGKVIYKQTASQLINNGYLVRPRVKYITLSHVTYPKELEYPDVYSKYIIYNDERNNIIKELAMKETARGTVLILVEKVAHGELLNRLIPNSTFTYGGSTDKFRQDVIDKLGKNEIPIVIATKIFDEGIDVRSLCTLILASGGKSSIKVIQRTGRILRLFEGKDYARIYDFIDKTRYLYSHSLRRRLILQKESEFIIE